MNYYALLSLGGFLANILLGCYILYRNPRDRLNLLFSFFAFAVAIWALGDFLVMTSSTTEMALLLNRVGTVGSATMPVFLLHFFLIFTKNKFLLRKISHVPLYPFLYLPALFFLFAGLTTDLITEGLTTSGVDYVPVYGPLYNPLTLYVTAYVIAGLLICYKFYEETTSKVEKKQVKIVVFAVSIPTIFGIVTQVVPPFFGLQTIRVTTTITAIMAVLIAYAIFKHRLMAPMSFSIRRKLVAGFLIISLLSGAVGYLSITITQENLKKEIGEHSVLLSQQIMDKIDRNIYNRIEEFEYYGNIPIVRETIFESNQEFEKLENIQNYIDEKENEWVSVPEETITPFMRGLMNNTLATALIGRMKFYQLRYDSEIISEAFITNKYGANIVQTGKTSDYYQADEEWWQKANETGLYVTDVDYDESADVYSVNICIRIDDEEGAFLGVIKIVLNFEEITNIIRELELNEDYKLTHFDLIDSNLRLIYSTEKEFEIFEDVPNKEYVIGAHASGEGYYILKCENTGDLELFAHAHSRGYRDYEGVGWILSAMHKTDDVFAPVAQLTNLILVITFVIVVIGVLFGIIFSQSLSKPIIKLKNVASKMGEGDLDIKIEIKSKDEIGDLASSFNMMSKSLKEQQNNLENLVIERTKELETKVDELQRFKKVTVNRELKMVELKKRIKKLEEGVKK